MQTNDPTRANILTTTPSDDPMQTNQPAHTKPSHPPKKSPHPSWQAQQQKLRNPPKRMLRRLAGKR